MEMNVGPDLTKLLPQAASSGSNDAAAALGDDGDGNSIDSKDGERGGWGRVYIR